MSAREALLLGTASQVPTRTRAHNAVLLRFDGVGLLVDPGEGAQRQLTHAGLGPSAISHLAVTHAHGDHCFGLPGVAARLALDARPTADCFHPSAAAPVIEALLTAAQSPGQLRPRSVEVPADGSLTTVAELDGLPLRAAALAHSVPTVGYRLEEPDGWQLDPELLAAHGVEGAARHRLQVDGRVAVDGREVTVEQVGRRRQGQAVAVVMDTGWCDGALALAAGADLLVIEATFLESEAAVADVAGHLTAARAARLAAEAGARRVVLTHLSQRYPGIEGHLAEARAAAPGLDLTVARDLDTVTVPPRDA